MSSGHPAFAFEVVTPEGSAFRGQATSLRLQGRGGSFGILAHHAPLVGALDLGVAWVELEGGRREELACGEGFVEVTKEGVRVLVDFCDKREEIDVARAREAEQRARERLKTRGEKIDHARAEVALRRALLRLKVAGGPEGRI
jgi:F-type H+-transporting ATPase subunit epsilon